MNNGLIRKLRKEKEKLIKLKEKTREKNKLQAEIRQEKRELQREIKQLRNETKKGLIAKIKRTASDPENKVRVRKAKTAFKKLWGEFNKFAKKHGTKM